jgi:integrase
MRPCKSLIGLGKVLPTQNSGSAKSSASHMELYRMSQPAPGRPTQALPVTNHFDHPSPKHPVFGTGVVPANDAARAATPQAVSQARLVHHWPTPGTFSINGEVAGKRQLLQRARLGRPFLTPFVPHIGPVAPAPPVDMAELLLCLAALTPMPLRKQRDTMSAVRAVGRVVGRPLHEIATDPAQLRTLLSKASPAMAQMSPERWTAVRSMVLGALLELGIDVMPGRARNPLSPAWASLSARLTDKSCRVGLSRILRYFSREGIEPENVDAAALRRFRTALIDTSLRGNPETAFQATLRFWRLAASSVPGWPAVELSVPSSTRIYALGPDCFPASFLADVDAFSAQSGNPDPFSDGYTLPIRPSTIALRRKQIFQVASGLVASGMPIEHITSLGVLVDPENAKAALRHLLDRKAGTKGTGLAQQAQLLRTIARYWVKADEPAVFKLSRFVVGLAPKRDGMVRKNRERLRQFDLPANVDALMRLPKRMLDKVEKDNTGSHQDALRLMFALAVEILIVAPMRVQNLCELDLDRDIIVIRRGRARHLHISIAKTKTEVRFERGLPVQTIAMFDTFVDTYRMRVCNTPGSLLFPGREGSGRAVTRFSTAISEFIYRETGLVMNPHLFRHLAVKIHLDRHPDDRETPRLLLGHTSGVTVDRSYAENRTDHAFKRWDQTLASMRDQAVPSSARRSNHPKPL